MRAIEKLLAPFYGAPDRRDEIENPSMEGSALICPVCNENCSLLDVVDFNKACNDGGKTNLSGIPIYYALCDACGFCYAPEIITWTPEEFARRIYNEGYREADPDYEETRPRANASWLISVFGSHASYIRHLDYGGGNGLLSKFLFDAGFNSSSYDPFENPDINLSEIGKFDLITAYEVFEHVPDPDLLVSTLRSLLAPNGVILFSTNLSDGNISKHQRLTWWYASPRNGHISLFSQSSLALIGNKHSLNLHSFNYGFHAFCTSLPHWISPLFAPSHT